MRVVFLTTIMTGYRIPFHYRVRAILAASGIRYDVVFGQPDADAAAKENLVSLSWGKPVVNRYLRIGPVSLVWQPALRDLWSSDLVVISQENRLLVNYVVQSLRVLARPKVALWGHGRNFQADPGRGFSELWKRYWTTRADWWFAYTEESRKIVQKCGFPADRITVFNNAVDTSEISRLARETDAITLDALRGRLQIDTNQIGVYVGGIYDHKRVDFLLEAANKIRGSIPDFVLIIVGSGVGRPQVEQAASDYPWIRYLGPLFGSKKVEILRLGRVFLMPGLVGLAVLDCAAAGLPIVTTAYPYHSPEFAYLEPGKNGLVVQDWRNSDAYAQAVVSLLHNDELHAKLAAGASETAMEFTIERMADRFSDGIIAALSKSKL